MTSGKLRVWGLPPRTFFFHEDTELVSSLLFLFVIIAAAFIWSWSVPALTIRQLPGNRVVYQIPMHTDGKFKLIYIHSIHRTPVEERYHINAERKIVVDAVVFDTYGVGMPSSLAEGETLRLENGKMITENMNRVVGTFDLRIGQVIANHTLYVNDKVIPLSQISAPGSAVRFEVDRLNLFTYLRGVLRHGG
ncbi:DUF1850 domain-containing protein [Cohnella kolymensis]|uniref:DUF1850 domain-containing protein n=1 Tax=Cohnella kolymensis TaxID=1590652 RepID=UPI00069770F9|nr:DUF1850 domain-containing protein [Cohnella kolymensis]